jgi:hypothetical protein
LECVRPSFLFKLCRSVTKVVVHVALALAASSLSIEARAQAIYGEREDGESGELRTVGTLGLTDSVGWSGQDDGTKAAAGFAIAGKLALSRGNHTFDAHGGLEAAIGKARGKNDVAKARDGLTVDGVWAWRVVSWFGTYGSASLEAAPLGSSLDHATPVAHSILRPTGERDRVVARSLVLTDPGAPLRLRQELGLVLLPVDVAPARVAIHSGAAARQTVADDQLAVSDDPTTPVIELEELDGAARAGIGGGFEIDGVVSTARIHYRVRADLMTPLAYPARPSNERGALNFTDVDLRADISFRLVSWASLDYAFQALREPLVLNDYRVRSSLVVSIGPTVSFSSSD